jgi:hypothetical protein
MLTTIWVFFSTLNAELLRTESVVPEFMYQMEQFTTW